MSLDHRRSVRVVLSFFLLLGGTLLAVNIGDSQQNDGPSEISGTLLSEPELQLRFGRQQLSLTATTSSAGHEATLLKLIAEQFAGVQAQSVFRPGLNVPQEWEAISTRLVYLVAATQSAEATADSSSVTIRGVSDDGDKFQQRLEFVNEALLGGMVVESDVLISNPEISTTLMCSRNFASISKRPIQFRQSSTAIRPSSYPLLDRLSEFAYDCRVPKIAIIGHTDASGEESWNLQVSQARAQAVAELLVTRGVAVERLIIEGLGSRHPLAENDTVQGRERNRRIEFELRQL